MFVKHEETLLLCFNLKMYIHKLDLIYIRRILYLNLLIYISTTNVKNILQKSIKLRYLYRKEVIGMCTL